MMKLISCYVKNGIGKTKLRKWSYKYFGAAKELPGVGEIFEQEPPPPPRKTRAKMMKDIDADYYGYMDDDDGILIPLEMAQEKLCGGDVDGWMEIVDWPI